MHIDIHEEISRCVCMCRKSKVRGDRVMDLYNKNIADPKITKRSGLFYKPEICLGQAV